MRSSHAVPLLACLAVTPGAAAQEPTDTAATDTSALRVFLDCPDWYCDLDYLRTELTFVNWVREPQVSQVHVLLTTRQTGAGGREFTLSFIGRERFGGAVDTLAFTSLPAATEHEIRADMAQTLRLGLVRFAARTPAGRRLRITFQAAPRAAAQVRDPWGYWVFRVSMNGYFSGEESYKFADLSGSLSATRVTEHLKTRFQVSSGYGESRYSYQVDSVTTFTFTNITRNYSGSVLFVRSISPRWSAGLSTSAGASTFFNQDLALRLAPGVEFAFWPYAESTRRLLTARYELGVTHFDYRDSTIFDETAETRLRQRLSLSLNLRQPWGSTGVDLRGATYLHDLGKLSLELFGNAEFRVFKGLSVNFWGSVALLRDQLYLSKADIPPEEVLVRRQQLETAYLYYTFVGLSYTFGSIYSNIVNPRYGGSGGGFALFN